MTGAAAHPGTGPARGLTLKPGSRLRWHGGTYLVAAVRGTTVHLASLDDAGHDACALIWAVTGADDFALLHEDGRPHATERVPDVSALEMLAEGERQRVRDWERHLIEIRDGVPPNLPDDASPRPGYDPAVFTLKQRFAAKAGELKALGFTSCSAGTVARRYRSYQASGVAGLLREVTPGPAWGRTDERVVRLLLAEVEAGREESDGSATRLLERLRATIRLHHPDEYEQLDISPATFYRLLERLGISSASLRRPTQQRIDEAALPIPPYTPTSASMLGEQVQIDSTGLDIIALGDDGRPVQLELTCAIDVATRSIIGALIVPKSPGRGARGRRLGGRATKSFDAVLMLAQALAPTPARPGWSPLALARNSTAPYADLVAMDPRLAGAAARPLIRPKMVVVDHGKVFTSEHFTDVCTALGISVRSARTRTPTDKAIVESLFSAIKKLFCQYVAGYTGSDLARRGKNLHDGPLWSINELQDLLDEWIALHWQQRPHDGLRNPFLPGMKVSPNQMYAALVAAEGYVPLALGVEDNRRLLLSTRVKVTRKGVRINNRTYNSPAVQQYYKKHSGIRGQGMKWQVRYNPYAPRFVWLYDHTHDTWAEAEFIHQRLIGDDWTQYLWEQVTAAHVELGGNKEDERAIARAVAGLRERARRGPSSPAKIPALFTGPKLALRSPQADRYAAIRTPLPGQVGRVPSLNVPARELFPSPTALPDPGPVPDGLSSLTGAEEAAGPPPVPAASEPADVPGAGPILTAAPVPRAPRSLTGAAVDLFTPAAHQLPAPELQFTDSQTTPPPAPEENE
jgi:hypothetical protein